jgi:hypothetical protein
MNDGCTLFVGVGIRRGVRGVFDGYPSVVNTENGVAMSGYSHLSRWERDQIAELKAAGRSVGAIAQAQGK